MDHDEDIRTNEESGFDFDITESRLSRLWRTGRPYLYAAAAAAALFALQWLADAFRYAPVGMALIAAVSVVVVWFVFKPPWHHAVILSVIAALLFYPAQLVLFCGRFFVVPFTAVVIVVLLRGLKKNHKWYELGYRLAIVFVIGVLLMDIIGPLFMSREQHGASAGAVRMLDNGKTMNTHSIDTMLLAGNDRKLFLSCRQGKKYGVAAISTQSNGKAIFVPFKGSGVKLISQDTATGNIYAADRNLGILYELDYDTLKIVKRYDLTQTRFSGAVVDSKGYQFVVATYKDGVKIFRTSDSGRPWYSFAMGDFGFRLFPNVKEQKLPELRGVSRMIMDTARRRVYLVSGFNRNLVVIGLDDRKILKIERGVSAGVTAAAIDEKHGTLMLAGLYGSVDLYDGERTRPLRKIRLRRSMRGLDYDPTRDMAVAGGYTDGRLYFIERATGRIAARPFVKLRIRNVAVSPRTGKVYITCEDGVFEMDPKKFGIQ